MDIFPSPVIPTYSIDGLRISKIVNGVKHEYYYVGSRLQYEKFDTTELWFFYDPDGTPSGVRYKNGSTTTDYYFVCNWRGDVVRIYDSTGALIANYDYDAWGKVTSVTDANNTTITSPNHIANVNPIRYRGYYYDSETKLYYVNSRYYDPEVGRWINADRELAGIGESIQGYNLFAYCHNNPVNMNDPDGNWPKWATKVLIGTAVIGVAAVVTVATGGAAAGTLVAAVHCVAAGALQGAIVGAAVGAAVGATTSAVKHRVTKKTWKGSGKAALEGGASGFMTGAITGAITGGMKSNVCFVAGTAVLTSAGHVAIEDICAGDKVWSENPETGEKEFKEVVQTFVNETNELVHVFANGEEIITTPEHPFYVPTKGWTGAIYLRAGDILVLQNGKYVVVEKIQHELLESPIKVYNFEVEDFHTYYVGESSVLVHNLCKPKSPVKVSNNALKKIDVHAFKAEFVSKNIAHWDVFKDTANNSVLWLGNKSQTVWHETGYFIKDLLEIFPK